MACAAESGAEQIHHQERDVVEHVRARDAVVELDRIEQHRRAIDEDDVPEVEVAVTLPDVPGGPAGVEERRMSREGGA